MARDCCTVCHGTNPTTLYSGHPTPSIARARRSTNTYVFPTWSWASSMRPFKIDMEMEPVYSLAYWVSLTTGAATASGALHWSTLKPTYARITIHRLNENLSERYIVAALSWLHGCLETDIPSWLTVDCTRDEYAARLEEHWSIPPRMSFRDCSQ